MSARFAEVVNDGASVRPAGSPVNLVSRPAKKPRHHAAPSSGRSSPAVYNDGSTERAAETGNTRDADVKDRRGRGLPAQSASIAAPWSLNARRLSIRINPAQWRFKRMNSGA
jgi:hypothetical protein